MRIQSTSHERRILAGVLFVAMSVARPVDTRAQSVGTCQQPVSIAYLDANNVRALIRNTGNLFDFNTFSAIGYEVPVGGGVHAMFASQLLILGRIDEAYAGLVSQFQYLGGFWTGPVFPGTSAPPNCDAFDRIYKIRRSDVVDYEATGQATTDLAQWPTGLGAPTLDADGNRIELQSDGSLAHVEDDGTIAFIEDLSFEARLGRTIDLAAGERPDLVGDQMLWWIMNDLGSSQKTFTALPIGLEVHASAFAFDLPGALGNTTFYKYRVFHRGVNVVEDAYIGLFFDADLGYWDDDFVGVDTTLGLGFSYNASNEDGLYGIAPPAIGVDFFQGPLVDADGLDNDRDGSVDERGERLQMTSFIRAVKGGGDFEDDPINTEHYYNILRGRFRDGVPVTVGGVGRDASGERTTFQFSGAAERGEYWSQINVDGQGTAMQPEDTRFVISSGPIDLHPGDEQEIVFGVVWARGSDHLDSIRQLKEDDDFAQTAYNLGFDLPETPSAPHVTATPLDGQVILEWTARPGENNYLESYREKAVLAPGDYVFEGYRVYQFEGPQDLEGTLLATYDVANGITRIIDGLPGEPTAVTANGTDSGIRHSHVVDELINYRTYYFGVQAYAYNEGSIPKVYVSPMARVDVVPTRINARDGGTILRSEPDFDIAGTLVEGTTEGTAGARIVNPAAVTGHEYQIVFFQDTLAVDGTPVTNVDILDLDSGEKKLDGRRALRDLEARRSIESPEEWLAVWQRENVAVIDGLQFTILGPLPDLKGIIATANAAGPIDPPDMAAYAFNASGFPIAEGVLTPENSYPQADRPTRGVQQATSSAVFGFHTADTEGNRTSYDQFVDRTWTSRGSSISRSLGTDDFEMRFTQACLDVPSGCQAWRRFADGQPMHVPFELWNVGPTSDPADDFRLLPVVHPASGEVWHLSTPSDTVYQDLDTFDFGGDHPISGGANDPVSDWVYWYEPVDRSPGQTGYDRFFAAPGGDSPELGPELMARTVLVNWNGWSDADGDGQYDTIDAELPEPGTVFRIVTKKGNVPGVVFAIDTAGYEATRGDEGTAHAALDEIGIVPNPYKGASAYEVSHLGDEVRFTNMPLRATIRVFDLAGTLVRTLEKNSPESFFRWNLRTDEGLPIASGIYFIHVDVPDVGERALKFAVVRKGTRLQTF